MHWIMPHNIIPGFIHIHCLGVSVRSYLGFPGASEGSLQKGSWKVASDISRSWRVERISSRLGGDMRGLSMLAPTPPLRGWLALTWDRELTDRGELLGVVDVSFPSSPSLVGEPSWSANEAELKGRGKTGSKAEKSSSFLSQ